MGVGAIQAIPHAYLKMIAKLGGLDAEKDMVVAGIAPTDTVAALEHGAIDGFSGGPPVLEQSLHDNAGVVIADGNGNPSDPPWLTHVAANVLLTQPQTCAKRHELCVKMGRAMVKANSFMHDHPKEAMEMLGKRFNVTDKEVLAEAYKHALEATPVSPTLDTQGLENADRLNIEAGFMKAEDKLPSYAKIFTNEYVK